MELGEITSVALADEIASAQHDEDCYFCKAKEKPETKENDLSDDFQEDDDIDGLAPEGLKFKNDAGKLGKALGGFTGQKEISVGGKPFLVTEAAHHLIPGNAALKNSSLFKSNKYLWKDGKEKGNIAYNVNNGSNGVWLPGNYAVRPWSAKAPSFQDAYAHAAIRKSNKQFHDAHEKYNKFVLKCLEKIFEKLEAHESIWCPEAKKKKGERDPQKDPPLYEIVARLNTVSARMNRMLVYPSKNWKNNIYTSSRCLSFKLED